MSLRISLILNVIFFLGVVILGVTLQKTSDRLNEVVESLETSISTPSLAPTPKAIRVVETIPISYLEYIETNDLEKISSLMDEYLNRMDAVHCLAEAARELGCDENHPVILFAKEEWHSANNIYLQYKEDYNILYSSFWDKKAAEYPTATYIWLYLKEMDFNDYVCAGIMGNLMAEVGGQTLKLNDRLYTSDKKHGGFYGICQWSSLYYPQIHNADLETQCEFLKDTIQEEFEDFGDNYSRGFDYNSFLEMTNERDAALAFAKVYERCGKSTYGIRQSNAEVAYNYFTT